MGAYGKILIFVNIQVLPKIHEHIYHVIRSPYFLEFITSFLLMILLGISDNTLITLSPFITYCIGNKIPNKESLTKYFLP